MDLIIRQELFSDFVSVYTINCRAFGQENEALLVDKLRKSKFFIPELSLVALVNYNPVGHILFTRIQIINERNIEHESLVLAPMAVLPEFQNRGIGSKLVDTGLSIAKESGFKSVIVVGHKLFYPRFGFSPASEWNIKAPFDVPEEVFMAKALDGGNLGRFSGIVRFPQEFDDI